MKRTPSSYAKFKKDRCEACGTSGSGFNPLDPDHVKTLGSGGKDLPSNIMTLCRKCHGSKGSKGISYMANTFPSYKKWLIDNGWHFEEFRSKWVNYEK